MNAYTTKDELALLSRNTISHAEHYTTDRAARPTLFARIAAFFQRQSTLHELSQLTDRELADIGLNRADLHLVFEPAYARARNR